jgi:DNA-binding transcriptional LysR family regulator
VEEKEALRLECLKTFMWVIKIGSFSATAKELRLSQATVSNHIATLENYFGAKLLNRTLKGVKLTEAGRILKESAEKIMREIDDAKAQISTIKNEPIGVIRIAASTIPGEHVIPSLIAEFIKRYPRVSFKIKPMDSMNGLKSLEENIVDFAAVGSLIGFEEEFEKIELTEEELVLIVPPNHELEKKESVKLHEILKYPYINREETSGTRKEVERMLERSGIHPQELNTVLELGSTEAVITAVSDGWGVSIISSIAAEKAQEARLVKALKIDEAESTRKLYIIRPKKKLNKVCGTFWEFCKEFKWQTRL